MQKDLDEHLGTHQQIMLFYDRLGGWLDTQRLFKAPALNNLLTYSEFDKARLVYEVGCGTGLLAEKILRCNDELVYQGTDLSSTMVQLARERLSCFGSRATVLRNDSTEEIELVNASVDRFVSTYVFDLMSTKEIIALLDEAYRVLTAKGRLCLVSLTKSKRWFGRMLTYLWLRVHEVNPMLMGGCRPLDLADLVPKAKFLVLHHSVEERFGLSSEVLVAEKRAT